MFGDDTAVKRKDSQSCGWRFARPGWRCMKPLSHVRPYLILVLTLSLSASCCAISQMMATVRHMATCAHDTT